MIHFTQVVIKLITKVQIQHQEQQQPRQNLEPAPNSRTDFYIIKAGEPSFDPLSCPFCYGVLIGKTFNSTLLILESWMKIYIKVLASFIH